MDLSLAGRTAVVGGSTQGIGRAAAAQLAALGASVTLLSRDATRLAEVLRELPTPGKQTHRLVAADLGEPAQVRAAAGQITAHGPVHIFVHNTGGPPAGTALDAAPEAYAAAFTAHLVSGQILVQALVPGMKTAGYGRIVNVISTSIKQPIPNLGVSNAVRGAVAQWAKTLATELGPFGITVNNVLPGYTRTERLNALVSGRVAKTGLTADVVEAELVASIPAGRFGRPEETAAAIAFLCSPAAAYINGINLPVDGGRLGTL